MEPIALIQEASRNGLGVVITIIVLPFIFYYIKLVADDGKNREGRIAKEALEREDRLFKLLEKGVSEINDEVKSHDGRMIGSLNMVQESIRQQQGYTVEINKNLVYITNAMATVAKGVDNLDDKLTELGRK